jgi:hypothetical protein
LFAQDEMQVAEHPALGSLREYMLKKKISTKTVEKGLPTPILIQGVERRCSIATEPDAKKFRPFGLYGNLFSSADMKAINLAVSPLIPPSLSNILAMEAPSYGQGKYTRQQILFILTTAYAGFAAAKIESFTVDGKPKTTIIHTGFWGCGAYGGNRQLMVLLQWIAACLANVDRLIFYTFDVEGEADFSKASDIFRNKILPASSLDEALDILLGLSFYWGVSDGN